VPAIRNRFVVLRKEFKGEVMQKLTRGAFIRLSGLSALIISGLLLTSTTAPVAQGQDMKNMPGMKMGNPKPKAGQKAAPRKRKVARTRRPANKHQMGNMPGMNMPGMNMSGMQKAKHARGKKRAAAKRRPAKKPEMGNMPGMSMPGMNMPKASPPKLPGKPTAQPAPQPMQMNMPGMQMPATSPLPSGSPQKMEMNMPGTQMPSASPNPQASPQQKKDMNMPMPQGNPSPGTSVNANSMANMPGMGAKDMGSLVVMSGNDMGVRVGDSDLNVLSCGQMGTGTSWTPPSSPMYSYDKITGKWLFMFHFNAFVGVNSQGGPRGVTKLESQNWIMPMAFRKVGPGTLQLRGMFSFEPFTFPRGGSPLLLQTGETYKGQPLVDRQHPHDFWMELSATYTVPLGERATWFTYFGYPGEPALGPPAFMHRPSASENPSAALSHHLQDSTHISFGVLTSGFTYRWFKLEGSIFNGREPDENRYNFEAHPWNSRSARLSFTPNQNWSAQVSYGFLRRPEAAEPNTDIRRTTASIEYNKPFSHGNWAAALIWGRNHQSGGGESANLNGYTAESTLNFIDKDYLYTRLELVDKNELLRPADRARLGIKAAHPAFRIGAYTFGGARDIWNTKKLSTAIGSDVTFYSMPSALDPIYGKRPVSWRLFLRIRPARMDMSSH
jgi:hypothetical protein